MKHSRNVYNETKIGSFALPGQEHLNEVMLMTVMQ
jgi:hypothetical protein